MAQTLPKTIRWEIAPDCDTRKRKRTVEKELLEKITIKNDLIEFHPMILSSRPDKSKFCINLKYSRVSPPWKEILPKSRDPWLVDDPALRQVSYPAHHGPRNYFLPNLVKPHAQIRVWPIPATDIEYHRRRSAANKRLTSLFDEWTAYNQLAYPEPTRRMRQPSMDKSRNISKKSMINIAQGHNRRKSSSSTSSSRSDGKKDIHALPRSHKKKNRWRDAMKEVGLLLKASRMEVPEELPRTELRIYVSSTPDLQEEREFMEEVVYPRLQEICEEIGLNCHVVDMRRGSGTLNNDLKTFDLIKQEIRRCRKHSIGPYFLMLIGQELDDNNLPGFLDKAVYEQIRETIIKENIVGVEAFDDVYRLDSNRIPPVYIKQPICSVEEYKSPEEVERVLFNALSQAVSVIATKLSRSELTQFDFYKWSAVVKEVEEGLLTCHTPKANTLCFMMDSDQTTIKNDTPICRLRYNIFQHYKQYASLDNLVNFKSGKKSVAYLRSISDTIESGLASLLKRQVHHRKYDITQQLTDGFEVLQHVHVAQSETENTSSYTQILTEVKDIIQRNDTSPKVVLIWGLSGTGKTAVASQIATSCRQWEPGYKVVFRCLGTTLRSSSLFRALESVVKQTNFIFALDIDLPNDLNLQQTVSMFCDTLKTASAKCLVGGCKLLLVLDQIDLLPDLNNHCLLHILNSLTECITLVLTLQTPNNMFNILKSHKLVHAVLATSMTQSEVCKHLTLSLSTVNRVVTNDQLSLGLNCLPTNVTPLHAQILTQTLQWWPSHTLTELKPLSDKPENDFIIFLDLLEKELGKSFTKYALSFLACARFGLADVEIFHLLSKDSDLLNEIKEEQKGVSVVDGFPYQYHICRLISMLDRFVISLSIEGEAVYQIRVQPLVKAIMLRYLNNTFLFTIHTHIANFFMFIRRGLLLSSKDISEQNYKHLLKYNWRTLRCVPYHLCYCSNDTNYVWLKLKEKVFFNFAWLVNEIYDGFFNELVDDITYALDNVSLDPDIQYLQKVLISVRQTVIHNPLSLAAFFASQNTEDSQNEKDSVVTVVNEARLWLKQVHRQALVPVFYTSDKTNRLMMKENCILGVTDLKPIMRTDRILIQRNKQLLILHISKDQEVLLTSLSKDIHSIHVIDEDHVLVVTADDSSKFYLDVFNLQGNKHTKTMQIDKSNILWIDAKSLRTIYCATNSNIKCLDFERGSTTTLLTRKMPWEVSCLSTSKPERLFTVTLGDKTKIEITSTLNITETKSMTLMNELPNHSCQPLRSTRDGNYLIYLAERQALVIDLFKYTVISTYTYKGLSIINAEFSSSHEHIFLAFVNGSVICYVLRSGIQTMITKIRSKSQSQKSQASPGNHQSESPDDSEDEDHVETITTLVTSDDDHFLFCGTSLGHVYVIHVPTGFQLVDITTQQDCMKQIYYLTSRNHFQHFITVGVCKTARHWNMRPLLKQARKILQDYISDEDLLKEEKLKLDLNKYFMEFETKKHNRIFLNGPDIKGFYNVPTADIFASLVNLDPAFGIHNDWEATGNIVDLCDNILSLVCACELGNVMLSLSKDFRLAKWNLQDGSLIWSKGLPPSGKKLHKMASVYYDQAVLLVQKPRVGNCYEIYVIYTREDNSKIMFRDNVINYWTSVDRSYLMVKCQDLAESSGTSLYLWDLINCKEVKCDCQHPMSSSHLTKGNMDSIFFSPTLRSCVSLVIHGDEIETKQPELSQEHIPSSNLQLISPQSVSNMGKVFTETYSDNNFDIRNEHLQPSTSQPNYKKELILKTELQIEEPQYVSDTSVDQVYFKTSSPENQKSICYNNKNSTNPNERKILLKNVKTNLYWTKVSKVNINPQDAEEDITVQTKMKHPSDKSKDLVLRKVFSPLNKDKNKVQTEQNSISLKNMFMNGTKQTAVEVNEGKPLSNANIAHTVIPLQITSLCFVGEHIIFVGTSSKHLFLMSLPSFHPIYALGQNGPKIVDEITETSLTACTSPHKDCITHTATSENFQVLISSDSGMVCLWEAESRTLTMKIDLAMDQKISHMVVSKDAIVVAMVTNSRTIQLWTPVEQREIASYRTMFDIVDFQMTCDCRKVIVRGFDPENKDILEIFDVLNIDDILMHVTSRKDLQHKQRQEHLTNERKMNRPQAEPLLKSPTLNVIDESELP